jgi:hypothetical protein
MTTSSNPFGNTKSEICGPLVADCALLAIASNAAVAAAVINRFSTDWPFAFAGAGNGATPLRGRALIAELATLETSAI